MSAAEWRGAPKSAVGVFIFEGEGDELREGCFEKSAAS